jgi:hypothetical protein
MMRTLMLAFMAAFAACVLAWFVMPATVYVEDALGILLLVFALTATAVVVVRRVLISGRKA